MENYNDFYRQALLQEPVTAESEGRLVSQENEEPTVEHAQENSITSGMGIKGYSEFLKGLTTGNPQESRRIRMQEREARARRILEGEEAIERAQNSFMDANGFTESQRALVNEHQQNVNAMPIMERFQNFLAKEQGSLDTFQDNHFYDILMRDRATLVGQYGENFANAAEEYKQERGLTAGRAIFAGVGVEESTLTEDIADIGLSVAAKGVSTVSNLVNAPMNFADPEYAKQSEGMFGVADWLRDKKSDASKASQAQSETLSELREQQKKWNTREFQEQGDSAERARQRAEQKQLVDTISDLASTGKNTIEQASEIGADLVIGAGVYGVGAKLGAKAAGAVASRTQTAKAVSASKKAFEEGSKQGIKSARQDVLKSTMTNVKKDPSISTDVRAKTLEAYKDNLNSPLIKQNIDKAGRSAGNQNALSKSTEIRTNRANAIKSAKEFSAKAFGTGSTAIHGSNQEAQDSIIAGYDTLMSMSPKALYNTNVGQKEIDKLLNKHNYKDLDDALKDSRFVKDFEKLKSDLAIKVAQESYKNVFAQSFGVNLFTSGLEGKLAGAGNKLKGLKAKVKDSVVNTLKEMGEEYIESGAGAVEHKKAVNKILESEVYNPTDLKYERHREGVRGAVIAALGTGGLSTLGGSKDTAKTVATKGLQKYKEKQQDAINTKNAEHLASAMSALSGTTSTNSEPSKENNSENNQVEVSEDLTSNTNSTVLSSVLSSIVSQINSKADENSKVTDDIKGYAQVISQLHENKSIIEENLNQLNSKESLSSEEQSLKQQLEARKQAIDATFQNINDAYNQDLNNSYQRNNARLNKIYDNYRAELESNPDLTSEEIQIKQDALQKELAAFDEEVATHAETLNNNPIIQQIISGVMPESNVEKEFTSGILTPEQVTKLSQDSLGNAEISEQLNLFDEAIEQANSRTDLNPKAVAQFKRKLANDMVQAVKKIASNSNTVKGNAKPHWKNLTKLADNVLAKLSNDDFGLEPNHKNVLVDLMQEISDVGKNIDKVSDAEALTLMGKYVGTLQGGYKNKGNIGLLGYVQNALANKGHLDGIALGKFNHFGITQVSKLNALKTLLAESDKDGIFDEIGNVVGKPLTVKNYSLKTSTEQLKQDRDDKTTFKNRGELVSYIGKVEKDVESFNRLYDAIATKQKTKQGITGSKATVSTTETKPKKQTKPVKPPKPVVTVNNVEITSQNIDPSEQEMFKGNDDDLPPNLGPNNNQDTRTFSDETNSMFDDFGNAEVRFVAPNEIKSSDGLAEFKKDFASVMTDIPSNFKFTEEQWSALHQINNFLDNYEDNPNKAITISGYAGTGKSTIVKYAFTYRLRKGKGGAKHAIYTAPTHAAGLNISEKTGIMYMTTRSFEKAIDNYKKPNKALNEILNQIRKQTNVDAHLGNVAIVIDELSMVSDSNLAKIIQHMGNLSIPVVLMGDPLQLPEVSGKLVTEDSYSMKGISRAFTDYPTVTLTEVKRTGDSTILESLTRIRESEDKNLNKIPLPAKSEGSFKYTNKEDDSFGSSYREIRKEMLNDFKSNPNTKVIVYDNKTVNSVNLEVRQELHNYSPDTPLQEGETIIGYIGSGTKKLINGNIANSVSYNVTKVFEPRDFRISPTQTFISTRIEASLSSGEGVFNLNVTPSANVVSVPTPNGIKVNQTAQHAEQNLRLVKSLLEEYFEDIAKSNSESTFISKTEEFKQKFNAIDFTDSFGFVPKFENGKVTVELTSNLNNYTHRDALKFVYDKLYPNGFADNPYYGFSTFVRELPIMFEKGLDFGYAITIHKSQGTTIDNVYYIAKDPTPSNAKNASTSPKHTFLVDNLDLYVASKKDPSVQYQAISSELGSLNYVALSRAANKVTVIFPTNRDAGLSYKMGEDNHTPINRSVINQQSVPAVGSYVVNDSQEVPPDYHKMSEEEFDSIVSGYIESNDEVELAPEQSNLLAIPDAVKQRFEELIKINKDLAEGAFVGLQIAYPNALGNHTLESFLKTLKVNPEPEQIRNINIYAGNGENVEASNLYPSPIEFRGIKFESVEHAYQNLKSLDNPLYGEVPQKVLDRIESTRDQFKTLEGALRIRKSMFGNVNTANNTLLLSALMSTRMFTDTNFFNFLTQAGINNFTHNSGSNDSNFIQTFTGNVYNLLAKNGLDKTHQEYRNTNPLPELPSAVKETKEEKEIVTHIPLDSVIAPTEKPQVEIVSVKSTIEDTISDWDSTATWISGGYDKTRVNEARLQGIGLTITKEGEIEITNPLKDKNVTISEIDSYTSETPSNYGTTYLRGVANIKQYFKDRVVSFLPSFNNVSGILNLGKIKYNTNTEGERTPYLELSESVYEAFYRGLVEHVSTNTISSVNPKQLEDDLSDSGSATLVIEDLSYTSDDKGKILRNRTMQKSKEAYLAHKQGENVPFAEVEVNQYSLSTLGTYKTEFIESLGNKIMKELGISWNEDSYISPEMESMSYSLGVEVFNMLQSMGLIKSKRLLKIPNMNKNEKIDPNNIVVMDFVSFSWDSDIKAKNQRTDLKDLIKQIKSKETSYEDSFKAYIDYFKGLYKGKQQNVIDKIKDAAMANKAHGYNLYSLNPFAFSLLYNVGKIGTTEGKAIFPAHKKETKLSFEPVKATLKDTKNKTSSGNNPELLAAVQAHNDIAYRISTVNGDGLYTFLKEKSNQEILLDFLGRTDTSGSLDSTRVSEESKYKGYQREMDIVFDVVAEHPEMLDKDFYLPHKVAASLRVMVNTPLNPQALKIIREIVRPKDPKPYGFEVKGSILDTVEEAISMVQKNRKISDNPETDRANNIIGFSLALAQALDIKLENMSKEKALNELLNKLRNEDIQSMITELTNNIKGRTTNTEVFKKAKDLGINSPRGFNALYQIALMTSGKSINELGLFQPMLSIEGDGKGNGVSNNVRQFSTAFTEDYFTNLKRTGTMTLDLISELEANGKNIEDVGALETLFDKSNPVDTLADVYEAVSEHVLKSLHDIQKNHLMFIGNIKNISQYMAKGYRDKITELEENLSQSLTHKGRQEIKAQLSQLRLLATGFLLSELNAVKGNNVNFNTSLDKLDIQAVARSIAKSAVTPSNYGGQLDGITSQLNKDIKDLLKNTAEKAYQDYLANPKNLKNQDSYVKLYTLTNFLGTFEQQTAKHRARTFNSPQEKAKAYFDMLVATDKESYQIIKDTLGSVLNDSINAVYGEQFAMVRGIVSLDNALFSMFISEYMDAMKNAIDFRNIRNGWVDSSKKDVNGNYIVLNPRALNPLTKKQIKGILSKLTHLPNVATGYSEKESLVNNLFAMGNSITQKLRNVPKENMSTVMSIYWNDFVNGISGSTFKQAFDSYTGAGASLLISSIVSTESRVQKLVLEKLQKKGIKIQDVFDGIEINPIYAELLSQIANESYQEVHQSTSLIRSFYDYFVRSNPKQVMMQAFVDNVNNAKETYESLNNIKGSNQVPISAQTVTAIQTIIGSAAFIGKVDTTLTPETKAEYVNIESLTRSVLSDLITKLTPQGSSTINRTITLSGYEAYKLRDAINFALKNRLLVDRTVNVFRDLTAQQNAMQKVEENYLPIKVEQFGGVGKGHLQVPAKAQASLERFKDYMHKNAMNLGDSSSTQFRKKSKILADFITTDPVIRKAFNDYKKQALVELAKVEGNTSESLDKASNSTELLKNLDKSFKELNDFDKSLSDKVEETAVNALKNLIEENTSRFNNGQPIRVTYDKQDLIDSISNPNEQEAIRNNDAINAYYTPKVIYLSETANKSSAVHELVHAGLNNYIYTYFTDPSRISSTKRKTLSYMTHMAMEISSRFLNNNDFVRVFNIIRNDGNFSVNRAYSLTSDKLVASAANIQYAFSKEFASKNSPETVALARSKAMQEFMAYGLTTLDMMNWMQYNGTQNRSKVLQEKGLTKVWDNLKTLLNGLYAAFRELFGMETRNDSFEESYLHDFLAATQLLGTPEQKLQERFGTLNQDSQGNAEIVPFGVSVTNSQKFIDDMKVLYDEVVGNLDKPEKQSYIDVYTDLNNLDKNQKLSQTVDKLRASNLAISPLEENMFKVMAVANKHLFDKKTDVLKEASKVLKDISDISKFNKDFAKIRELPIEEQLALVQTNERLSNMYKSSNQDNKLIKFLNQKNLYRNVHEQFKDSPDYMLLGSLASKMEYDNMSSAIEQAKVLAREDKLERQKESVHKLLDDVAAEFPVKSASTVVRVALEDFFSGLTQANPDTNIELLIRDIAANSSILKGKQTLLNKIVNAVLGVVKNTQYIYSMQNKSSILGDSSREKIGNLISENILRTFKVDKFNESQQKALKDGYGKGNLGFLSDSYDIDLILSDDRELDSAIAITRAKLLNEYSNYSNDQQDKIEKFLDWQLQGLAELNMTGSAKSTAKDKNNHIIQSVRAISGLTVLNQLDNIPSIPANELDSKEVITHELLALHSIKHMGQDVKDSLRDLYKNYKAGMRLLDAETLATYRQDYNSYRDSYMGYSNYKATRTNPNKDYVLVSPSDKDTLNRLSSLGYENRGKTSSGNIIMFTNQSLASNFTIGGLSIIDTTIHGSRHDGLPQNFKGKLTDTSSKALLADMSKTWNQVKAVNNYYNTLIDTSNVQSSVDYAGNLSQEFEDLPSILKEQLLEESENVFEYLGNRQARNIEEISGEYNNIQNIRILHNAYLKDNNKGKYIKLDGNFKPKGNDAESIRFANEFNNFYKMLPRSSKAEIESLGGLYLRIDEVQNIIGYNQASITDMFTGKSGLPKPIQKAFVATSNVIFKDLMKVNPAKTLKQIEMVKSELATLAKDYVLNRSFIVPIQNLLSNVIHLAMVGINPLQIPSLIESSYREIKEYQKLEKEIGSLNHELRLGTLSEDEKNRKLARLKTLQSVLDKSEIGLLVKEGIYTNISNQMIDAQDYSKLTEIGNKLKVNQFRENLPSVAQNLLVMQGSKTHEVMEEFMNYGDFLAKYALYKHLTRNKGWDKNNSIELIRDEFINYSYNRGREFDWLNKVGLTWFLSYKLGIQKIIYRNLRRNTLRTLAVWQGANLVKDAKIPYVSAMVQTVPQQRFWTDYSGYHFEMDNMFDSFKAHWLANISKLF